MKKHVDNFSQDNESNILACMCSAEIFAGERADPLFSNKVVVVGTRERLSFNISIHHREQGTKYLLLYLI